MKLKHTKVATLAATLITFGSLAGGANAALSFTFQEVGDDVVLTSSGSFDITGLPDATASFDSWGWVGIQASGGLGGVIGAQDGNIHSGFSSTNAAVTWNVGTDTSVIGNWYSGGFVNASGGSVGSRGFTTYVSWGTLSGFTYNSGDLVGSTWIPDLSAAYLNTDLSGLGITPGSYSVVDSITGESITINAANAAIPEPSSVLLLGLGTLGLSVRRRRTR